MSLQNHYFPLDTNFFNEEVILVISLMSPFLGLDTYRYVTYLLMSVLFKVITSKSEPHSSQSVCLKFNNFLTESIHSQLVIFYNTKHFWFQFYLVRMFLFFNEENLQLPKRVSTDDSLHEFI